METTNNKCHWDFNTAAPEEIQAPRSPALCQSHVFQMGKSIFHLIPSVCDSAFSLQAVVPSSTTQDIYLDSNIFKAPGWNSGVLPEGSSSHIFPSRLLLVFLVRDGFDNCSSFMKFNWACWLLQQRTTTGEGPPAPASSSCVINQILQSLRAFII